MSNKNNKECCKKTSIGGQAVIEGIMMRGPHKSMLAVRNTKGDIILEEVDTKWAKPNAITKLPLIRGVMGFIQSLVLGYKTLMRSADLSGMTELEEEEEIAGKAKKLAKKQNISLDEAKKQIIAENESSDKKEPSKLSSGLLNAVMVIASVLGVVLALLLFMYLPSKAFNFINHLTGDKISAFRALIEGIIKVIIFVAYILIVSQTKDIKRVFQYHGAEHKTIFCYEKQLELNVENVKKQIRFHPRCGTSFMFLMIAVGIIFSTLIVLFAPAVTKITALWVLIKILLIPLFCGVGYELIKFCGRHDNLLTKIIAAPGLWIQRITTKEPDDDMIEVAIAAIKAVIPENGEDDKW